jgi:hypothetical protein
MKRMQTMLVGGLICAGLGLIMCVKDYDPFENIANTQIYLASDQCSPRIKNNQPLSIFTAETLALYSTAREKIDSIVVRADNNRLWTKVVMSAPLAVGNYLFPLSFADTGWDTITATAFRSNNTTVEAGPFKYHVTSPLKQDSIMSPQGVAYNFSTVPVGDNDVYYWWSFGTAPGDTIMSPFPHFDVEPPSGIAVGKTGTGYLWVTDTSEKIRSPATAFVFEFYKPALPLIKCVNNGLTGDTLICSDTLVFSVQIIDSSQVGIKQVEIGGASATTTDNITYSMVYYGMIGYTQKNPKAVRVAAINNVGDSAVQTYYCYYNSNGPAPELVRLTLVNPTSSITTRLDSIVFAVHVDNFTSDTVSVKVIDNGSTIGKQEKTNDSAITDIWYLPLSQNQLNGMTVQASLGGTVCASTTIGITQNASFKDTTAPQIIWTTINGKLYTPGTVDTLSLLEDSVRIAVMAFDNESGIDSVTLKNGSKPVVMNYYLAGFYWTSDKIAYSPAAGTTAGGKRMSLNLTIINKAAVSKQESILITKRN